jgi:2-polyprenyl-6-methoxyphenol hydroxylase-like FAD-dependent oxidoreductase
LTTGLLDAATFGNCFIRIFVKQESDELLTKYADTRRKAWLKVTNPESTAFKHRVSSMEPEHVEERTKFFDALNNDPNIQEYIGRSMSEMLVDFSTED